MSATEEDIVKELDYSTFVKIINNIPSCIFYKDTELRYRFSTHYWEQLNSDNIIGKTDLEIRKDKENAIMAMEMDRNIIRSGKGCSYVIKSDIDGHVSYLELIKEPVFGEKGEVIGIVGLINDVTEKTVLEQKLNELNTTDTLTKLMNRRAGTEAIEQSLNAAYRNKAFCLLDINKFKAINDTFGHVMGDKVLSEFGAALKRSVDEGDIAMRLGGDEFIVLLHKAGGREQVIRFIDRLHENIDVISVEGYDNKITVSIGAKIVTRKCDFDTLYLEADKMMYTAKKQTDDHFIIA